LDEVDRVLREKERDTPTVKVSPAAPPNDDDEGSDDAKSDETIHERRRPRVEDSTSFDLLEQMRRHFEDDAGELSSMAASSSASDLNEPRYRFLQVSRATSERLKGWELKHLPALGISLPALSLYTPAYASEDQYVFPVGSSVIVRESEPSSIIALALSAKPFRDELASPTFGKARSFTPASLHQPLTLGRSRTVSMRNPIPPELLAIGSDTPVDYSRPPSLSSASRSSSILSLHPYVRDPDDPLADYDDSEEVEIVAKVKKRPKGSLILGMRGAMSRQRSMDSFGSIFKPSPVASPVTDTFGLGDEREEQKRKALSESVLNNLVSTSDTAPSDTPLRSGTSGRALPQVLSGVTKRHVSEATTSTSSTSISIGTVETFRASTPLALPDPSLLSSERGCETPSSRSSRTCRLDVEDESDATPPLANVAGPGSRLVDALWTNLPGSIRNSRAFSPSRNVMEDSSHVKFSELNSSRRSASPSASPSSRKNRSSLWRSVISGDSVLCEEL
jgi:hypothetical protein